MTTDGSQTTVTLPPFHKDKFKMKYVILLIAILLLITGCDQPTATAPIVEDEIGTLIDWNQDQTGNLTILNGSNDSLVLYLNSELVKGIPCSIRTKDMLYLWRYTGYRCYTFT